MMATKLSEVKNWLKAVGTLRGQKISINEAGEVDVKGNISLYNHSPDDVGMGTITELPFKFGTIEGSFEVLQTSLKSLKGFPHTVIGSVAFVGNKWENLEHGPKRVTEHYACCGCELKSLHGAPERVESFNCANNNLTNLDGLPKVIDDEFTCTVIDMSKILELKGVPAPPVDEFLFDDEDQLWSVSGQEIAAIKKPYDEAKMLNIEIEPRIESVEAVQERKRNRTL